MAESNQIESWDDFLGRIHPNLTYPELLSMTRRLEKLYSDEPLGPDRMTVVRTKIALTGNHTLSFARAPLDVFLARHGIRAEWFIGEFDNYKQELLAEDSTMYAFEPQVVILLLDHHAIGLRPEMGAEPAKVEEIAERQVREWEVLWEKAQSRCGASVVQTNIALPCERVLGHYEAKTRWSVTQYLRRLNQILIERAPSHVSICDAEHLSGLLGKRVWFDEPMWYNTGQGLGFKGLVALTYNLAAMVGALLGKSRKCLVLDLDDTLWGGIVGDVGVEGIKLGRGDPVGEAFVDFQAYCRSLKERGVLLAVCSKNNPDIAREAFENHPEMVLKLKDFSAFVANWDDKATNLRRVASELNLGTDSLVLVDDNPAERALVRKYLPEVAVPEMPADPALYRRVLDEQDYFEVVTISKEDLVRTSYYLAEEKRKQHAIAVTDITDFLKSLEQVCKTGPFDEINLQRIVQLINKTNQWNLTTQRLTEGEVRERMTDPAYYTLWVRHQDRFGDNGLIAVLIARQDEASLDIEGWLMSCRVINRGIEDFIFNEVLDEARHRDVVSITGTYRPTKKNGMVGKLYEELGFEYVRTEKDGSSRWLLPVSDDVCNRSHFIKSAGAEDGNEQEDQK